jgi:dCMP deaminase
MTDLNTQRPSLNEYFKEIVKLTSSRSSCKKLHVGCLLILNNRIISQGYNGHLPGCPHESIEENGHELATIHAEQNALIDCAKRGVSTDGAEAYITHYPCINCAKLLLAAGIKKIWYINDYKNNEHVGKFCNLLNVELNKII